MSENNTKFSLDLRSLLEEFDLHVNSILIDETKNQAFINNSAKNLMIQISKFRNEYNYQKERDNNCCLDSSFSSDDETTTTATISAMNQPVFDYVPSSSSGESTSTSSSLIMAATVDTTQILVEEKDLKMDAQSVTLKADKWENLLQIKQKSGSAVGLLFDNLRKNKHIWSLNRVKCDGRQVYLFYIFKDFSDKKPMRAFYAKDIDISMEGEKFLRLKVSNLELKYEAETNLHAKNWLVMFNKAKSNSTLSYEERVIFPIKQDEIMVKSLPTPPDKPPPKPPTQEPLRQERPISEIHASLTKSPTHEKIMEEMFKMQQTRKGSVSVNNDQAPPPIPISSIPPKPSHSNNEEEYDEIEAVRVSVQQQNNKAELEDYINNDFFMLTQHCDLLYLCHSEEASKLKTDHELEAKIGDIVQLLEKLSEDFFIAKNFQTNLIGFCNYKNFVKIYHNE